MTYPRALGYGIHEHLGMNGHEHLGTQPYMLRIPIDSCSWRRSAWISAACGGRADGALRRSLWFPALRASGSGRPSGRSCQFGRAERGRLRPLLHRGWPRPVVRVKGWVLAMLAPGLRLGAARGSGPGACRAAFDPAARPSPGWVAGTGRGTGLFSVRTRNRV